jgi:putative transposase
MPQSLSSILIHLVFSTKNRARSITPDIEPELYPYLATVFRNADSPTLTIGGTADHLHILFSLSRTKTVAEIVKDVKADSSEWIKTKGAEFSNFYWQSGYGSFSIGQSSVAKCVAYIARQKEHHKKQSFKSEFRGLLKKYEVPYDERYVWD